MEMQGNEIQKSRYWVYFTHPKKQNIVSWLIQKVEKIPSSHCAILYYSKDFSAYTFLHSKMFNLHQLPMGKFLNNAVVDEVYQFDVLPPELEMALSSIGSRIGESYSYIQLFVILLKRLFHFAKIKFNGVGSTCSEAGADFVYASGIDYTDKLDTSMMGLVEFRDLCRQYGKKV